MREKRQWHITRSQARALRRQMGSPCRDKRISIFTAWRLDYCISFRQIRAKVCFGPNFTARLRIKRAIIAQFGGRYLDRGK